MPDWLYEEFDTLSKHKILIDKTPELPTYITDNLRQDLNLREYQEEALRRFMYYMDQPEIPMPTQLLFCMATGSGKTLLMAANILYLYEHGYRSFLFFVNSTNIIEKTRDNFLNQVSSKYLFANKIMFDGAEVLIKEVPNFSAVDPDNINIAFSTIQLLHARLMVPREDSVSFEDFENDKIVFISDEAHHINTLTKALEKRKLTKTEDEEYRSWEQTVNRLFNANSENVLLEYTATAEISNPAVARKYMDKLIYQYSLKEFREDGYSKDIDLVRADDSVKERTLRAVLISQYRRKIAEKHGKSIKPVLLFKSRTIGESKQFAQDFRGYINNLSVADLRRVEKTGKTVPVIRKAFEYFSSAGITMTNLIKELKEDFEEEKCRLLNSENINAEDQITVNTLEAETNKTRAIFVVDMLNEGWDVLNLFDIVRLDERSGSKHQTISDAQLIGRGARYCPFKISDDQDQFKRKYDNNLDDELRLLEELYYHSINDSEYIKGLRTALTDSGIMPERTEQIHLEVKPEFKSSELWKNGTILLNKALPTNRASVLSFSDLDIEPSYPVHLTNGKAVFSVLFEEDSDISEDEHITKTFKLGDFGTTILLKAMDRIEFYRMHRLLRYFPNLTSRREMASSLKYAGSLKVDVTGPRYRLADKVADMGAADRLAIARQVLSSVADQVKRGYSQYEGSILFEPKSISDVVTDRSMQIIPPPSSSEKEEGVPMKESHRDDFRRINLADKDWYVYNENYGTVEEKAFIKYLNDNMEALEKNYTEIFLVRNEKLFQIYAFSDGRATEPDFVIFLRDGKTGEIASYQLFVEAKGKHLEEKDHWKEVFLCEIADKYEMEVVADMDDFRIMGLPFFNERPKKKESFDKAFKKGLGL